MARTTTVTDDLDGSPGAEVRTFSIGTHDYLIDLTDENWRRFLSAVEPFREVARLKDTRKNKAPIMDPQDRAKIRAWAADQGIILKPRGRFPNDVVRKYYAEHSFLNNGSLAPEDRVVISG